MGLEIKIMSLNVAGLLNIVKRKRIAKYLKQHEQTLSACRKHTLNHPNLNWLITFFREIFTSPSQGPTSAGALIGIEFGIPWVLKQQILDPLGRYVILQGLLFSQEITIIGVYTPSQNQTAFWDALNLHIPASNTEELLMLGDFNSTMDSALDRLFLFLP